MSNPKISYALPIGTTLKNGKYTILKVIGAGGMGITYLAKRETDEIFDELEQVVIKELFITPNNTTSHCTRNHQDNLTVIPEGKLNETFDKFKKRFLDEAKTLYKFRNLDGMVQVKDLFEENGTVYFTMQYIDGQNLHDFVVQKGKLSLEETLNYLTKIAKLLHGIHQENFLHRDVKPENILIDKNGNAYLIDFGIAKCYDEMGIVKTLTAMGTKRYAPPEQLAGKKELITTALDVFGLANTFYYCLTGTPPQTRDELDIEGYKQVNDYISISETVNNIIEKGRKRNPKERTESALDFINALLKETDGKTDTLQKPDIPEKPDNENTIIEQPIDNKTLSNNEEETFIEESIESNNNEEKREITKHNGEKIIDDKNYYYEPPREIGTIISKDSTFTKKDSNGGICTYIGEKGIAIFHETGFFSTKIKKLTYVFDLEDELSVTIVNKYTESYGTQRYDGTSFGLVWTKNRKAVFDFHEYFSNKKISERLTSFILATEFYWSINKIDLVIDKFNKNEFMDFYYGDNNLRLTFNSINLYNKGNLLTSIDFKNLSVQTAPGMFYFRDKKNFKTHIFKRNDGEIIIERNFLKDFRIFTMLFNKLTGYDL